MKINILFAALLLILSINLSAQSTEWLNTTQGSSHEFSNDIALDDSGNLYQVGSFIGTVDLDPTSGIASLTSNGNYEDCFIRKFDVNGNFLWVKSIGSKYKDKFELISIFNDTLEILTSVYDTIDMNPNVGVNIVNTPSGNLKRVLLKLDKNGDFISLFDFETNFTFVHKRKGDYRYLYSRINTSIDLDFGAGSAVVTHTAGLSNSIVAKYDLNFNLIWYRKIECTGFLTIKNLDVDNSDNIIYSGSFKGSVDINLDNGVKMLSEFSTGFYTFFFSKLNSSGDFVYGKTIPSKFPSNDFNIYSTILSNGDAVFVSSFIDSMDLNPDENVNDILYANGNYPLFIIRVNSIGDKVSTNILGTYSNPSSYGVLIENLIKDNNDNIYIAGKYFGSTVINISNNSKTIQQIGSQYDFFVTKFSFTGGLKWFKQIDIQKNSVGLGFSDDYILVNKVLVAPNQKVFATGSFFGNTANFDTANTNFTATPPNGKYEGFLMRFNQPVVSLSIDILDFYGKANQKEQKNQLYLKYFTDENKQYSYNVLKSKDGIQWETIIKKQAQINTTENQYFEDQNPFSGINYYKIEVFENDQFLKNSKIIAVNFLSNDYKLSYYNGALYSTIENDKIEIYDLMGKKIMDAHLENYKLDLSILNRNQFYIIKSKDANLKIIY
jgi:hypothetical protein